jgi:hypothetical protein
VGVRENMGERGREKERDETEEEIVREKKEERVTE